MDIRIENKTYRPYIVYNSQLSSRYNVETKLKPQLCFICYNFSPTSLKNNLCFSLIYCLVYDKNKNKKHLNESLNFFLWNVTSDILINFSL